MNVESVKEVKSASLITIKSELEKYFDSDRRIVRPERFRDCFTYKINEVYNQTEPYWYEYLRGCRFDGIQTKGLLYRPQIVNEIIQCIQHNLQADFGKGLFVKGPQNIGKSFSLVNTVIHLESTGDYLVTFIPDCDKWDDAYYLVESIFKSFGTNADELGFTEYLLNENKVCVEKIIKEIDSILATLDGGKKWIFVFDQINCKFANTGMEKYNKISRLPYPFKIMYSVMKSKRITSVISASANNEASYKENHEGFVSYNHKHQMERYEVEETFSDILHRSNIDIILKLTSGVPGYVDLFLNECNGCVLQFEIEISSQVRNSFVALQIAAQLSWEWDAIKETIFASLLGIATPSGSFYDKKYFSQENVGPFHFRYHALIPAIAEFCKIHFFEDLMTCVRQKEAELLIVCKQLETPNSVRGFLFERIVINRFLANGICFSPNNTTSSFELTANEAMQFKLTEATFPFPNTIVEDGVYIPNSEIFPTIDVILKKENTIVGVQIHTSAKGLKVIDDFAKRSSDAGWLKSFDVVYLLFLSPSKDTTAKMQKLIIENTTSTRNFSLIALDISSIQGLEDLLWV
jgi:hypothetical protein